MGFAVQSQESKENSPHFALFLGKTNDKIFKEMQNALSLGPFCQNLGKNEFSAKIKLPHFLASVVLNFMQKKKKTEKTDEPILRKTLILQRIRQTN